MVKWAFLGAKEQGKCVLNALAQAGYKPELIVTLNQLPIQEIEEYRALALRLGSSFALEDELSQQAELLSHMDMALVCRFSLLPEALFTQPRLGSVNIHCSLLPSYRGVHPVQWALVNGEKETGVTLHGIDRGIDTGPILLQRALPIECHHDFPTLGAELNALSAEMCLELFHYMKQHNALPEPQPKTYPSSYARRRTEADSRIDWKQPAQAICNLVRAMQPPMPYAFFETTNGQKIQVIAAEIPNGQKSGQASHSEGKLVACGDGWVKIWPNFQGEI